MSVKRRKKINWQVEYFDLLIRLTDLMDCFKEYHFPKLRRTGHAK